MADAKADRIGRELKVFLQRTDRKRGQSPRLPLPISMDKVLAPAVGFAVTRLRCTAPPRAKNLLAKSAWDDLRRDLSARLAFAMTPTLRLRQSVANAVASNGRGAITLFESVNEFPGLLTAAAQLISAWINAQRELFDCFSRDKADLCAAFLRRRQSSRVTHIRPRLSDPHDGAKSATMIEFVGRRRVIYKPRSPNREELWFGALHWLNRNGLPVSFRVPKMLARRDYVWMEFLQTRSCDSFTAVRRFYFRWGAQAALAQVLAATDLHRENWLAVGSQPILVDAELLGDAALAAFKLKNSLDRQPLPALLQTGLLPLLPRDKVGFYRGIAPFDVTISKSARLRCWPRYRGVVQEPSKHVNDLVGGFEAVAEMFTTIELARTFFREIILPAARRNGRLLFRASAEYAQLLRESFEPRNMISTGERRRRLARECCASSAGLGVGLAEARALLRCDIPKFTRRQGRLVLSWKRFSAAAVQLRGAAQLLRRRVLLGTRIRRP